MVKLDGEILEGIDKIISKEVAPLKDEVEKQGVYPRNLFRILGREKVLGLSFPEEYGGMNLGWGYTVYFAERLSYTSASIAEAILSHICMGAYPIFRFGSEYQKRRFLIPSLSGDMVGGMAMAEPDAGSDLKSIRMKAYRDGKNFRLTGNKVFISNANNFDYMIFVAKLDDRLSLFIVEREGNEDRITTKPLSMMGMEGADLGEIFLEDAFCPEENLLGQEGEGFRVITESLNLARLLGASCCLGIMKAAYDHGLRYAKEREQFGRKLVEFQSLRFMLVDMAVSIEISKMLIERAFKAFEEDYEATKYISIAKLYASEAVRNLTDNIVHLMGAYGYCKEYPVEKFLRDAHCFTISEGTNEIQREILSREFGIRT